MDTRAELRAKLEKFVRKYYQNRLLKGLIYALGLGLAYFLLIALAEMIGQFSTQVRMVLFFALLGGMGLIFLVHIVIPLINLLGLARRMSYEKAALIIGKHFPEVDDKLINTLQLEKQPAQSALLEASIDQKIAELKPVPFQSAVDYRKNLRYWPIVVLPVLAIVIFIIAGKWPDLRESSDRLRAYKKEFIPDAPFNFILENDSLVAEEGTDLTLKLDFSGDALPAEVDILLPEATGRMIRNADGSFQYRLENLRENTTFRFSAAGYSSQSYEVQVLDVPRVKNFRLIVEPPAYTGMASYSGDLKKNHEVPEGSRLSWFMNAYQTDSAFLISEDRYVFRQKAEQFQLELISERSFRYDLITANANVKKTTLRNHQISVIRDERPEINVDWQTDSSLFGTVFYTAQLRDDYGISSVKEVVEMDGRTLSKQVAAGGGLAQRSLVGSLVLDSLITDDAATIRVYLQVYDNDRINGAKVSNSQVFTLRVPDKKEREARLEQQYDEYFDNRAKQIQKQQDLQKQAEDLKREMAAKKKAGFKEKQQIQDLLNKQQELLKMREKNEERKEQLKREEESLHPETSEELQEREDKIDKLEEKNKDLEELMKELEELMKDLDTDKLRDKLEEFEQESRQQQQMMEREQNLMEDLKFQRDVLREAQKLEELAQQMDELSKEDSKAEEKLSKQEDIQEKFDEVKEKIGELEEQNEDFKEQNKDQNTEEKAGEAQEEMDQSKQNLQQNDSQKAGENQKSAGEKMQEMSESLQMAMMQMGSQQNKENIETLRQILENLKTLSFDIEALSDRTRDIEKEDPAFRTLLTEQYRLQEGSGIIRDSLMALASRVPEIEQVVFEELGEIDQSLGRGIQELEELNTNKASVEQQEVMTAANNLALLLDEALQQMLQQQAQMMPGSQSCQKPGNKPSSSGAKKLMQQLSKQMGKMGKGKKPGKQGNKSGESGEGEAQELVKMMSRQEQLRRMLEEMQGEGSEGSNGSLQKAIDALDDLEQDMLDGRLGENYKERLQEIETRLLEHENAELEQDKDEERKSNTADEMRQIRQDALEEYLRKSKQERESIYRNPVEYRPFYKQQTEIYLK